MSKVHLLAFYAVIAIPLISCDVKDKQSNQTPPVEEVANIDRQMGNKLSATPVPEVEFAVPEGITYKPAEEATNKKARELIKQAMEGGQEEVNTLFASNIMCGPALWNAIHDEEELSEIIIIPMQVLVPILSGPDQGKVQKMTGGFFRPGEGAEEFCKLFNRVCEREYQIRLLNERELEIYWAMIPYDIEEPIYVVETPNHKYLMDFVPDVMKVMWVDDLSSYK